MKDDLQKSDSCGLKSERKKILTSSTCSLACLSTNLGAFCPMVVHLPSEKSILPYFSGPRGVAISVPFPEVRNRKGAESGLVLLELECRRSFLSDRTCLLQAFLCSGWRHSGCRKVCMPPQSFLWPLASWRSSFSCPSQFSNFKAKNKCYAWFNFSRNCFPYPRIAAIACTAALTTFFDGIASKSKLLQSTPRYSWQKISRPVHIKSLIIDS